MTSLAYLFIFNDVFEESNDIVFQNFPITSIYNPFLFLFNVEFIFVML